MKETEKQLVRRCPRLGGPVAFFYCTACEANNRACGKIIDCWWETFDVAAHLRETLSEAALAELMAKRPKPKVTSLVEMIAAARENCRKA